MKQLNYFNICYDSKEINSKLEEYISIYPNNFINYKDTNHLIEIVNSKNIHLLITKYDYELLKQIKDIKLIQDMNIINEFIDTLKNCIKNIDSNNSNIVNLENNFIFDTYNKTLFKSEKLIPLTKKEALFLNYLISNKCKAVNYHDINTHIWEGNMTQDALRSLIKELRKKTYKELIKNVSGIGYRIDI